MLDLDKLEAIGNDITPGEWDSRGNMVRTPPTAEITRKMKAGEFPFTCRVICETTYGFYVEQEQAEANARFIATARNNWQSMIDEIRRLRDIEALSDAVANVATMHVEANEQMLDEIRLLRSLLEKHQWGGWQWDDVSCTECHALKSEGHAADCEIAKALEGK